MKHIRESDVRELLSMDAAIEAVEAGFRDGETLPRRRLRQDGVMMHLLGGRAAGMLGYKAYTTTRDSAHFHIGLFDGQTGHPVALIDADYLGQVRTGAASGVATKILARPDARRLGLFGTGKQARTQAWAISRVRPLEVIRVFGRDAERRRVFAADLERLCGCTVEPVDRPEAAVRGMDLIATATTSRTPLFDGTWLEEGTHLNVIGSNFLLKTEIDVETIRRSSRIVVDDLEQAKLEAGDFVESLNTSVLTWERVESLGPLIRGERPGRTSPGEITLFKSLGLGMEDIAVAAIVYGASLGENTTK